MDAVTRAKRDGPRRAARLTAVTRRIRSAQRVPLLQVVKTAVAAVLAWVAADLLISDEPPIFAAIAALLVVQPSVNQTLGRAVERSIGVVVGVALATLAAVWLGAGSLVIVGAIVVALFVSWLLRLTPGATNQVPISAMLVLALGASSPVYAVDRILETIIGAIIAFVVNLAIVPPVLLAPARREVAALGEEVARSLDRLADSVQRHERAMGELDGLLVEARLLRPMQQRARETLDAAMESLTLNPRGGKHRAELGELESAVGTLSVLVTRVLGMTRAVRDHEDASLADEPVMREVASELRRAAHDVRMRFGPSRAGAHDDIDTGPLLTAPLVVVTPSARHWVLIGSLLEDLRRVHEEVAGE